MSTSPGGSTGGSSGGSSGDSSGGSSDSGGLPSIADITASVIDRLFGNYPYLKKVAANPRNAILGIVLGWVVNRVTETAEFAINIVLEASLIVSDALTTFWSAMVSPLSLGYDSLVAVVGSVQAANTAAASGFGVFSPAITVGLIAAEIFALLFAIDLAIRSGVGGVLGSLPVVGTIFSALAQTYAAVLRATSKIRGVMFP